MTNYFGPTGRCALDVSDGKIAVLRERGVIGGA